MKAAEITREPPPKPKGPFLVIVVDPPWRYERDKDPKFDYANPYPSMSLDEIGNLPVPQMACQDCILWLWTTNTHLAYALDMLQEWGFIKKSILTWDKQRVGYGDWLKSTTEHCIMAVRGKPVVTLTNQTTLIRAPSREHSRKPEEFYQLVESLCPGSKLDFFARTTRTGWVAYGNETGVFPEDVSSKKRPTD